MPFDLSYNTVAKGGITMNNLDWLMQGNPVIVHLTKKYLINQTSYSNNLGYIKDYLDLQDPNTLLWGNGYYGPKWISTHYTLLELKNMEITPGTKAYRDSLFKYIDYTFDEYLNKRGIESMDLCITGMIVNMLSYANLNHKKLNDMIDYILSTPMKDGGWNCLWNHDKQPKISSVHTTINVLEGLVEYIMMNYQYRRDEVIKATNQAILCLLDRHLIYIKNTNTPIHESMANHHYPARWKYDYLRVLELLARYHYPYQIEMKEALNHLEKNLKKGKLSKGTQISGLIHFQLEETSSFGRFNTLRAYIILKEYNKELFEKVSHQEF